LRDQLRPESVITFDRNTQDGVGSLVSMMSEIPCNCMPNQTALPLRFDEQVGTVAMIRLVAEVHPVSTGHRR
jgi:hypothetical protein